MRKVELSLEKVKELFSTNKRVNDIAKELGCCRPVLDDFIKLHNLERRRPSKIGGQTKIYSINENYFETIDTSEKAYFLGLLYADGCNTKVGLSISLEETDKSILDKFNLTLGSNRPLYYKEASWREFKCGKYFCKPSYILTLTNIKISRDLVNLGCVPRKSLILTFPSEEILPKEFQRDFIRGYFDGDGCIYNKKGRESFGLIGTSMFLNKVNEIISSECRVSLVNLKPPSKSNKDNGITKYLVYGGSNQVCRIREWLYKDTNLYLNRKHKKFMEVTPSIYINGR